jgi:hypothetical protein
MENWSTNGLGLVKFSSESVKVKTLFCGGQAISALQNNINFIYPCFHHTNFFNKCTLYIYYINHFLAFFYFNFVLCSCCLQFRWVSSRWTSNSVSVEWKRPCNLSQEHWFMMLVDLYAINLALCPEIVN